MLSYRDGCAFSCNVLCRQFIQRMQDMCNITMKFGTVMTSILFYAKSVCVQVLVRTYKVD